MLKHQESFVLSPHIELYDRLIPSDHILRQLNELVDFSFVYDELINKYSSDNGRPAESPIRMFKYLLLKCMYDLSDRDLIERAKFDLSFKYFLDIAPEDDVIHPTALTKFRTLRLKDMNLLDLLLNKTVEIALGHNLIDSRSLIVDSTHTVSKYVARKPQEVLHERAKNLRKSIYEVDASMKSNFPERNDIDDLEAELTYCQDLIDTIETSQTLMNYPKIKEKVNILKENIEDDLNQLNSLGNDEAKIGYKTKDQSFLGYKTHLGMTEERIITAATITTGEKPDGKELGTLIEKTESQGIIIEEVIGDAAYSGKDNLKMALRTNRHLIAKLNPNVSKGTRKEEDKFEFNKDSGMVVCPAGHQAIKKARTGRKDSSANQSMTYYFDVEKCKQCPLREGCYNNTKTRTYRITIKSKEHEYQIKFQDSDYFKQRSKSRYKIEAKNNELKNRHGYKKSRGTGLFGMNIQGATTLFIVNMKRIIKLMEEKDKKTRENKQ